MGPQLLIPSKFHKFGLLFVFSQVDKMSYLDISVRLRGFFIVSGEALLWVSLNEHEKNTPFKGKSSFKKAKYIILPPD